MRELIVPRRAPTRCLVVLGLMLWQAAPALAAEHVEVPIVRRAIESVIELDAGRDATRLPRVTLDVANGDLTVVFAMRRPAADNPTQIVASATDDIFTILWAGYGSGAYVPIRTITVIGTYAVRGHNRRAREMPLVRAVLSMDRAASLDWTSVAIVDPRDVLDEWWVHGELLSLTEAAPSRIVARTAKDVDQDEYVSGRAQRAG